VVSRLGSAVDKADPLAFHTEVPPDTASRVCSIDYGWGDARWMTTRRERNALDAPIAVYELHLGSWRRHPDRRFLGYRELAPMLSHYAAELGFTHVELLPVMEHPFYGSWGYQTTGYFAPTSRYGSPQDLMYLIDVLHQDGIGVILDWVPSHFPTDEAALGRFDGTHLYEHGDPRQGLHPDWNSFIFNYGRHEVRSFLLSSAMYWLSKFHADMLRVDAVASMLYLDYSRKPGEWIPNRHGGHESLEAIDFLRRLNREVYARFPDVQMIAEESTAWPMVSRPTHLGGLGFGMKWDMGWMNDTLAYMALDPIHRKFHHGQLTSRMHWAFSENFILPLSHDEVVHGKGSLWAKLPGDAWQKFAQLRLLLGYMYAQPGKKLLFMGAELAELEEWSHERELDWDLLARPAHKGVQRWVRDLNTCYRGEPALHQLDCEPEGFAWIDGADSEQSVQTFLRRARTPGREIAVACNFTPVPRSGYRIGVPRPGRWHELLNSDAQIYGGGNLGNLGGVESEPVAWHGQPHSIRVTLPPLAICFFKIDGHEVGHRS
jgi:1,4-alpha-glucan branching enzyme